MTPALQGGGGKVDKTMILICCGRHEWKPPLPVPVALLSAHLRSYNASARSPFPRFQTMNSEAVVVSGRDRDFSCER